MFRHVPGFKIGGDEGIRTLDPCLAKAMLSQLSHIPTKSLNHTTTVCVGFALGHSLHGYAIIFLYVILLTEAGSNTGA